MLDETKTTYILVATMAFSVFVTAIIFLFVYTVILEAD